MNSNCAQVRKSLRDGPERHACGTLPAAAAQQVCGPAVNRNTCLTTDDAVFGVTVRNPAILNSYPAGYLRASRYFSRYTGFLMILVRMP